MPDPDRIRTFLANRMIRGLRAGHDQFAFELAELQRELGVRYSAEILNVLGTGWQGRRGSREGELIVQRSIPAEEALARLEA